MVEDKIGILPDWVESYQFMPSQNRASIIQDSKSPYFTIYKQEGSANEAILIQERIT